jgi:hypothetical protein
MEQTNSFSRQIPRVYYEAKQIAQNTSSNWLYKFQAFIFALLKLVKMPEMLFFMCIQKMFVCGCSNREMKKVKYALYKLIIGAKITIALMI